MLSQSERDFIRQGCFANCRSDGRTIHQYRPTYKIATGILPLSHGSSGLVDSGDGSSIHYLCSVKAEIVQPSLQHPSRGAIEISIIDENLGRNGGSQTQSSHSRLTAIRQAQAALQHRVPWLKSLQDDKSNSQTLCVIPSVAVWKLSVDLFLVSSNHICLDSASHCIAAALCDTVLPSVNVMENASSNITNNKEQNATAASDRGQGSALDHMVVDSDIAHAKPLIAASRLEIPTIVTIHLIAPLPSSNHASSSSSSSNSTTGNSSGHTLMVLDATSAEQSIATCAVHVVLACSAKSSSSIPPSIAPSVLSVWKTGSGSLPFTLLPECISTAVAALPLALQYYPTDVASTGTAAASGSNGSDSNMASNKGRQQQRPPLFQSPIIIQS